MNKNHWIIQGLFHGLFMFIAMGVLIPLASGVSLTKLALIKKLGFWIIAGFVYSLLLKLYRKK